MYYNYYQNLNELNQGLTKAIARKMEIKCNFFTSTELKGKGKKSELILYLCEKANALKIIVFVLHLMTILSLSLILPLKF